MSGEFGEYHIGGYFHDKIISCAEDCCDISNKKITRLWGKILKNFEPIAHAIAWCEAGDTGQDNPIMESIYRMKAIKEGIEEIERYLSAFKDVAEKAVRDYKEK